MANTVCVRNMDWMNNLYTDGPAFKDDGKSTWGLIQE